MTVARQVSIPLIRPISDLRTDLNSVCDQAKETQEPIYMTKNGKAALVVIDSQAYEEQLQHARYVQKIREAEIEARYCDETYSQEYVNEHMAKIFEYLER